MKYFFSALLFFNLFVALPSTNSQADARQFFKIANDQFKNGNLTQALIHIDSAVKYNPNLAGAFFLRGRIWHIMENYNEAIKAYTKSIELDPSNPEAFYRRSWLYFKKNYHRQYAIKDMNQAIALKNHDPEYYFRRAFFRARTKSTLTGNYELRKAIHDMDNAISLDHNNAEYYSIRGNYKFDNEDREAALKDYDEAIRLDPDNDSFYGDRGLIKILMENYNEAGLDLTRAIRLNPDEEAYYRNRAHASYNLGRYGNAISDYSQAIRLLGNQVENETSEKALDQITDKLRDIYLIRGSAFIQLNRNGEACDDFERSRDLGERRAFNYLRRYCGS